MTKLDTGKHNLVFDDQFRAKVYRRTRTRVWWHKVSKDISPYRDETLEYDAHMRAGGWRLINMWVLVEVKLDD